jgi:outer membrane assembly lipoprotein YfiO
LTCLALVVGLVCVVAPATPAAAQQEYIFSEETDQWRQVGESDPSTPEGQLATIRRALAASEYGRAETLSTQWIDRNERHPLLPEAYICRGDALRGQREYYRALFDYEHVARGFPGSEAFVTALRRELEIARLFATGTRRRFLGLRIVDATDEAQELLIRIQERMPGSSLAEEAGIELADFYFRRRDMDLAAEAYGLFIENHPDSRFAGQARRRLIFAHLASFKGPEFDADGLYEARTKLRQLMATEPATAQQIGASALLQRIDDSDASKMLQTARWYLKTGDVIAAEFTIRRLLRRYSHTAAARDALRIMPDIWARLPASVKEQAPDYDAYRAALLENAAPAPRGTPAAAPAEPEPTP